MFQSILQPPLISFDLVCYHVQKAWSETVWTLWQSGQKRNIVPQQQHFQSENRRLAGILSKWKNQNAERHKIFFRSLRKILPAKFKKGVYNQAVNTTQFNEFDLQTFW